MENHVFDEDVANSKRVLEQDGLESSEEGFMKGYTDEDTVDECSECESAIDDENKVVKEFDKELHKFCSKGCADEFEENL